MTNSKSELQKPCVHLVGAGPGDPELLTVKALRLLKNADVVVYDRLVAPDILDQVPAGAPLIYAGKAAANHHMPQDEINHLLVRLAKAGRRVVRLKGGDPFVFGRGSEEAEYLARHGVSFEVVPGVTAASGCAAAAGIPLTHRGLATGVRYVTGHCRAEAELDLDWDGLADPNTTLVFYMGLASLPQIVDKMIAAGQPESRPAAAIMSGATPRQKIVIGTIGDLQDKVRAARLQAPVLIIIGDVVSMADRLGLAAPEDSENMAAIAEEEVRAG